MNGDFFVFDGGRCGLGSKMWGDLMLVVFVVIIIIISSSRGCYYSISSFPYTMKRCIHNRGCILTGVRVSERKAYRVIIFSVPAGEVYINILYKQGGYQMRCSIVPKHIEIPWHDFSDLIVDTKQ